jgi:NADH-quinone oxidoreductase subunit J
LREGFWKHFPLAGLIGALIALEMALVLMGGFRKRRRRPCLGQAAGKLGNTRELGIEIYTRYLYPLQVAAVLLLVAIIAAIALTLRGARTAAHRPVVQQVRAQGTPTAAHRQDGARSSNAPRHPPPATEASHDPHPRPFPVAGAILFALSVIGIFLNRRT